MKNAVLLAFALLMVCTACAFCETIETGAAPYQSNGTVMVPMRAIFEWLGAEVTIDSAIGTITAKRGEQVVSLKVGDKTATINGVKKTFAVAPVSRSGRTFVSVRFVAEAFGGEVAWNPVRKQVSVTDNGRVGVLYLGGRDLFDLIAEKKVEAKATGSSIETVSLRIRRLTDKPIQVLIPAGTFFVSGSSSAQNMVARRSTTVTLSNDKWLDIRVSAACANRERDIPDEDDSFAVRRSPFQTELEMLMPALDQADADFAVEQAAVWIISDDADYDDLGTLVSGFGGYGSRVIDRMDAAKAMRIISQAGIDITSKAIWSDRKEIADGVSDQQLKKWLLGPPPAVPNEGTRTTPAGGESADIVATVNGEDITREQLIAVGGDEPTEAILDNLIAYRLVDQAARKASVSVSAKDVDDALEEAKKALPAGQNWEDLLKQRGVTHERASAAMKAKLQVERVIGQMLSVTKEEIEGHRRASHILVRIPSGDKTPEADSAAKEKIEKIAQEIKDGKSFDVAAREYSEDPGSKDKGGDLGYFPKGRMVAEFEKLVFGDTKLGDLSEPVKSIYGYHLIKVTGIGSDTEGKERQDLEKAILNSKIAAKAGEWLAELKKQAQIEKFLEMETD